MFHPGPVFTNLLLADEINRASPKTQAALLEAMQERRVTTFGETRPLFPSSLLSRLRPPPGTRFLRRALWSWATRSSMRSVSRPGRSRSLRPSVVNP